MDTTVIAQGRPWHRQHVWFAGAVLTLACGLTVGLAAQSAQSRCADCHFASPDAPARGHIEDWDQSPHGRANVGCERCHGGDETTFELLPAHRNVLNSANPSSPVHRANLPRTCGTCHAGPFVAFQESRHFELLNAGDRRAPSCSTCHEPVAARRLSPVRLEQQCLACHGPRGSAPRAGHAEAARRLDEGIAEVRALLDAADRLINHVRDPARRTVLEDTYEQAEVPLIQATQAGHRFVFDALEERLGVARQRAAALLQELANPVR